MSEDFLYQAEQNDEDEEFAYNKALLEIQDILFTHGCTMQQFELPIPIPDERMDNIPMDLRVQLNYNINRCKAACEQSYATMNRYQQPLFDELKECVDNNNSEGKYFFIDAPGGAGRTFLFNALLNCTRSLEPDIDGKRSIALAVAASGIASLLLLLGRTVHNMFKLGINVNESTTCNYSKNPNNALYQILKRAKILLWDEATMSDKHILHTIDRCLQDIMNNNKPFGGKLVIFGGDFRQTLTVVEGGGRAEIIEHCIKSSYLWSDINVRKLTINERVKREENANNKERLNIWSKFLLDVGDGKLTAPAEIQQQFLKHDVIEIPNNIISESKTAEELVQEIYPSLEYDLDEKILSTTAILTPKNKDVDFLNEICLNRIQENTQTLYSTDSVQDDGDNSSEHYSEEFLNGINVAGLPVHALKLKEKVPVMLLRNLSPVRGACNGTRLIIEYIGRYIITAKIITGPKAGDKFIIPRITLNTQPTKYPFIMKRKQFPIRLAYAMTINKSQGQTLKMLDFIYLMQFLDMDNYM